MGFVTPEEVWLKGEGKEWFDDAISNSAKQAPEIINKSAALKSVEALLKGQREFDFSYWRLACMGNWLSIK